MKQGLLNDAYIMLKRSIPVVYTIIFTLITVYLILRAVLIPLVHDEAETFFIYFVNGHFLPYQGWVSANNHFLNSFLGYISYKLLGPEEWVIRLPNLIFIPIYGYYLYRLSAMVKNEILRLFLLLTLICTPFFIDFFSLARGYGMAMALLMVYLYHFTAYLKHKTFKHFWLTQILGFFCLLASLTTFYIVLIVAFILIIDIFVDLKKESLEHALGKTTLLTIFQIIPAVFFTKYVIHLGSINELVVGTLDGIYVETIAPLVYWLTGSDAIGVILLFIAVFLALSGQLIAHLIKNKTFSSCLDPQYSFHILLIISIALIAFNGYVLDIPFPRDRAAMFLFPLFIFTLVIGLDRLNIPSSNKILLSSILLFFPISLLSDINLTNSYYWKTKRINPIYYNYIANHSGEEIATIGSLSLRESIWYHQIFKHIRPLNPLYIQNPETDLTSDFKIQPSDINPSILETYNLVLEDKIAGNNLYERKRRLRREMVDEGDLNSFQGKNLYHDILNYQVRKELTSKPYLLKLDLNIKAENVPMEFSLILNLRDAQGQTINQQGIRLSRLKYHWDDAKPYELILTLGYLPENTTSIKAFIFNNNENEYELSSGSYKIYKLVND